MTKSLLFNLKTNSVSVFYSKADKILIFLVKGKFTMLFQKILFSFSSRIQPKNLILSRKGLGNISAKAAKNNEVFSSFEGPGLSPRRAATGMEL